MQRFSCALTSIFVASSPMIGCKPAPVSSTPAATIQTAPTYPPRPVVPPPTFKVFHHDASSVTLVVPEATTDEQLAALLWELRDAAQAHGFEALHIPQKLVDARDPKVWFHVYRGAKCAAEKYAAGTLPCGGSYHGAADFTLGGFTQRDRTEGALLQDETHQTVLWNPDGKGAP
jgi:hypothetical protein